MSVHGSPAMHRDEPVTALSFCALPIGPRRRAESHSPTNLQVRALVTLFGIDRYHSRHHALPRDRVLSVLAVGLLDHEPCRYY